MNRFTALCLGACFAAATTASAQTLLLDFGPTAVSVGDATASPAHVAGAVPLSAITWNQVLLADVGSGILTSTGGATSVSINLGIETTLGNSIIDFSSNPTTTITGSAAGASSPLYSGTKVARDGISEGTVLGALGMRIDGLSVGNYVLYFTGRNTNSASITTGMRMLASTGSSSGTFNFSGVTNFADVTNGNTMTNPAGVFTSGISYNTLSFSITTGDSLFLAVDGTTAPTSRAFLNSVEIVAVPEPSPFAFFGIGLTALVLFRRKRNGR